MTVGVYCVPILGEPEFGISVKVPASWNGTEGLYNLGMGIDQEAAVSISHETNGQPKFLCDVTGSATMSRPGHPPGLTFVEFTGAVTGPVDARPGDVDEHEWWVKYSRAVGGADGQYDFPPHVVDVATTFEQRHVEDIDGELKLLDSPWDPVARYLHPRAAVGAASDPSEGPQHHQRRPARPRRLLAPRRHDRRLPLARSGGPRAD